MSPTLIKIRLLVMANSELIDLIQGGRSRTRPMTPNALPAIQLPPPFPQKCDHEHDRRE